jgi:hypothetical protein
MTTSELDQQLRMHVTLERCSRFNTTLGHENGFRELYGEELMVSHGKIQKSKTTALGS